jgi:gliding motility-associated-like protein
LVKNSTSEYTISKTKGATSYKFELPNNIQNLGQIDNSITVQWGDASTSGTIVGYPIVTDGTVCDQLKSQKSVTVFENLNGKAAFVNNDTLCVNDLTEIGIMNILGVQKDSIGGIGGITFEDTTTSVGGYNRYWVRFTNPGTYTLRYFIFNPCIGYTDTTQTIVVLPYPTANVGNYPVIEMQYYPKEVILDGSNSTHTSLSYPMSYKWSVKPEANVNNSTSMIASFVPQETKQTVYLTVANSHKNMCAVSDSAVIVVDLGIFIPNVFTPNGDGDHDEWVLENINAFYPNATVDIFSKWGTKVYSVSSYDKPWDGKRNGEDLPAATYYYVIDLKKPNMKLYCFYLVALV